MAILVDGKVLPRARAPFPAGRPYIGRKVQVCIDDLLRQYVEAEAQERQVPASVVWREIMIDGVTERYGIQR